MTQTQTTPATPLQRVVSNYEERLCSKWSPNRMFYNHAKINQKRFGMLLRGEAEITLQEAKTLSKFFKVSLSELS